MKHLRELIIIILLCAGVFLYLQNRKKDERIVDLENRDVKQKRFHDSVLVEVNKLTLLMINIQTNRNVLDTENKFLKKLREHDLARYDRLKNSKPAHLTDSAIMRAWAEIYPQPKRPN